MDEGWRIMFPQPMPRSDFFSEDSHIDLATILAQHLRAGFQPDLALDLVLNELVIRAAEATHANSAALALVRGEDLVCRAATGNFAPDLGVPLNPREGLSGVCLRTREPQLSVDTELDPRVAVAFSRRFGIRSVLAVPVFDAIDVSQFAGVLEVFSPTPAAFSRADQRVLEAFAAECARVRRTALDLSKLPAGAENSAFEVIPGKSATHSVDASWLSIPVLAPRILPVPDPPEPEFVMPPEIAMPEDPDELAAENDLSEAATAQTENFDSESVASESFGSESPDSESLDSEKFDPQSFASQSSILQTADSQTLDSQSMDSQSMDSQSLDSQTFDSEIAHRASAQRTTTRPAPSKEMRPELGVPEFLKVLPTPPRRSRYEAWSLVLGTLAILSIITVSFLIGSRIGWLRATVSSPQPSAPAVATPPEPESITMETGPLGAEPPKPKAKSVRKETKVAAPEKTETDSNSGDLVIYEKGKVVFRLKNPPARTTEPPQSDSSPGGNDPRVSDPGINNAGVDAPLTASASGAAPSLPGKMGSARTVWLNPADAEGRLVTKVEPDYPMAARTAHRAGDVVLEVGVAEDGSVYSVRALRGDPLLAAAAMQAVRNWRYQPFVLNQHPSQFHTDVTVSFATSN